MIEKETGAGDGGKKNGLVLCQSKMEVRRWQLAVDNRQWAK